MIMQHTGFAPSMTYRRADIVAALKRDKDDPGDNSYLWLNGGLVKQGSLMHESGTSIQLPPQISVAATVRCIQARLWKPGSKWRESISTSVLLFLRVHYSLSS